MEWPGRSISRSPAGEIAVPRVCTTSIEPGLPTVVGSTTAGAGEVESGAVSATVDADPAVGRLVVVPASSIEAPQTIDITAAAPNIPNAANCQPLRPFVALR